MPKVSQLVSSSSGTEHWPAESQLWDRSSVAGADCLGACPVLCSPLAVISTHALSHQAQLFVNQSLFLVLIFCILSKSTASLSLLGLGSGLSWGQLWEAGSDHITSIAGIHILASGHLSIDPR